MASIEIPSLPTADLNNMLSLVAKQAGGIWSGGGALTYAPVTDDNDLSPEPPTPKFGSSTPSFAESNAQFGFTFPRSEPRLSGNSSAVPVTNVSLFVSEAQPRLSNTSPISQPRHEGMDAETAIKETPAQYVVVHDPAGTDYTQTAISSTHGVRGPDINIPTTVLDKVGETRSRHSLFTGKPHPSELPTIMLASGDGKPASYIRFLNEPIPLPEQYEHQEVNIDKYRKPVVDMVKPDPSVPVDTRVLSDIDAIQRMEQDHVYLEPVNNHHYSTTDQCVPPADQNSGSEHSLYSESSDDCSSNSLRVYHNDSDVMIDEVAAYQSVEETPTFIELTTRPPPPPSTPTPPPPPPPTPYPQHVHQRPTYPQYTNESAESSYSETEVVKQPFVDRPESSTSLKDGLKKKIQLKRLQEGKGQLTVSFENRPLGEPTDEEKKKAATRKQKNRDSAVKSRERRQALMEKLEKEVKNLERENKMLNRDVKVLKEEISELMNIECEECSNTADQQELFAGDVNYESEQSNSPSFKTALSAFLAAQGRT